MPKTYIDILSALGVNFLIMEMYHMEEKNNRRHGKGAIIITKTRLFKYTDFFSLKNDNFQIKDSDIFIFLLRT